MNRSAYLTTGLAIKALSNLSKANVHINGQENIPDGPTIFVINHFTRIETLLLPCYIYNLTSTPVWSLADESLFKGGLKKFFDMVGVISTNDPERDKYIIRSMLTGEENWIIFPEGIMVKTKKIMKKGQFMVSRPKGQKRKPHTGAASLALRAEMYRYALLHQEQSSPEVTHAILDYYEIDSLDSIVTPYTTLLPVNLTYYPIRAKENIASDLASRFVKNIPERMVEEIMTEGTMLLSGVDLDINFGKPIAIDTFIHRPAVQKYLKMGLDSSLAPTRPLKKMMKERAHQLMQRYMRAIYDMTTVNHEHLFSSYLKLYPFRKLHLTDLRKRVFFAASIISDGQANDFNLHQSLKGNQIHLLTDDRYHKVQNFLDTALELRGFSLEGDILTKDHAQLTDPISFHRGRIDNPIEIIANEVEPLRKLHRLILSHAWQPDFLLNISLVRYLLKRNADSFRLDYATTGTPGSHMSKSTGAPFLLPSFRRRVGVVLVHSYLAAPQEVRRLAHYLARRGIWVYVPRLRGHGTSIEDLSKRQYIEWLEDVETGYAIISSICKKVVIGGVSVGATLALDVAARVQQIAGVFAICPPLKLQDFSTKFMPSIDAWNRIVARMKGTAMKENFFEFSPEEGELNYSHNPIWGVKEVGRLLERVQKKLPDISQPALVVQANNNPIIEPQRSQRLFNLLGSGQKEFAQMDFSRHVIINGPGSSKVHRKILDFIHQISRSQ